MKVIRLTNPNPNDNAVFARLCVVTDTFITIAVFMQEDATEVDNSDIIEPPTPEEFKDWVFSNTEDSIITKYNDRYLNYKVKLSDISQEFTDTTHIYRYFGKCVLNFYDIKRKQDYSFLVASINPNTMEIDNFISKYPQTLNGKESLREFLTNNHTRWIASFAFPSRDRGLTDDNNYLIVDDIQSTVYDIRSENVELTERKTEDEYKQYIEPKNYLPTAILSGPTLIESNGQAHYSVQIKRNMYNPRTQRHEPTGATIDYGMVIYVESSAGYIPVRSAYVNNGQFEFDLYADRVPVGTQVNIKVNAVCYTDLANLSADVF